MNVNQCWDWNDWDQDEDQEVGIGWTGINWEQIKQVGNWNGYQLKRKLGLEFNECEDDKRVGKSEVGVIGKIE